MTGNNLLPKHRAAFAAHFSMIRTSELPSKNFNLSDYFGRDFDDLRPRERGALTLSQQEFIKAVNNLDFSYAEKHIPPEDQRIVGEVHSIIKHELSELSGLIPEMEEGGFQISISVEKCDPGGLGCVPSISATLKRNGRLGTVYERTFGLDIHKIIKDRWSKDRFLLAIRKAKARIVEEEQRASATGEEGKEKN